MWTKEELAKIINARGHLIIGSDGDFDRAERRWIPEPVGTRIESSQMFNVDKSENHVFAVVGYASEAEFLEQRRIAGRPDLDKRPGWRFYLRISTD
jgi:hypothetical protein